MIETIVLAALKIVAAAAPGVLALATQRPSDEEAIDAMLEYVRAMPQREARGGDEAAGDWDRDLADRIAGGEQSE